MFVIKVGFVILQISAAMMILTLFGLLLYEAGPFKGTFVIVCVIALGAAVYARIILVLKGLIMALNAASRRQRDT